MQMKTILFLALIPNELIWERYVTGGIPLPLPPSQPTPTPLLSDGYREQVLRTAQLHHCAIPDLQSTLVSKGFVLTFQIVPN